jgi:hypothetical protein
LPLQSNSRHHPTPLFWYLGFHGNAFLNFINTPKASTHYGGYSYKSESVGQTLPQLPWKQKREDLKKIWIPFIKLHETL